jgi:hypothetical protein
VSDEVDALYALPPAEFTAARNELAKRTGDAELRKLKRPSQAAAVVNRLAWHRRADVERLVEAGRKLRTAQARGAGVAEATKAERDALDGLLRAARGEGATSDAVLARVRSTLQAAAADDDAAERVLAGRLEKELEPPGFGPLLAAAAATPRRPRQAKEERPRRDVAAERRRREAERAAQAELRAAEREEREAARALEQARRRVEAARAAVERATGAA